MDLSLRRSHEREILLDEDVFVVIGDSARPATMRSAWAPTGSYGPIPAGASIGSLAGLLDSIGIELWAAKRRGREACLERRLEGYDLGTALLWGADCVEHLARRARAVDGNVAETLALARGYARERQFQEQDAERLASEAEQILLGLRRGGLLSFGRALVSRALELYAGIGWFGPVETRYEAGEHATASLRAMQVAVMHATKALCGADPLLAGREAAKWCRRAAGRRVLAQETSNRSTRANESGFLNLLINPFASGALVPSLPGQLRAIRDEDDPETTWQAARLREYLERTVDEGPSTPGPC